MRRLLTWTKWAMVAGLVFAWPAAGGAVDFNLVVVDSKATSGPFGLLFDGSNIWFSSGTGGTVLTQIDQNTAGMPNTGLTTPTPSGGARAWDGSHFLTATTSRTVVATNLGSAVPVNTINVTNQVTGLSLIDGLDFKQNEIWYSPDVGNVYRLDANGQFTGSVNPVLGGAAGFSGVERITTATEDFILVVNDAFTPRKLCKETLTGVEIGCATLSNSRYEDLAWDGGQFLYAADFFGNRIDKIDLGASQIIVPPGVPEPTTLLLVGAGLVGLGALRFRRRG